MNKVLALSLLTAVIAVTQANANTRNEWHEPPVVLVLDHLVVDSVCPDAPTAEAHVRLGAKGNAACAWTLMWNWTSPDNYKALRVNLPARSDLENLYTEVPTLQVVVCDQGVEQIVDKAALRRESDMLSAKLVYDGVGARLYVGDSEGLCIDNVPYDAETGGLVMLSAEQPMRVQRLSASHDASRQLRYSHFANKDELDAYLAQSDDPIEGYWTHLDRDVRQKNAAIGGKYTLAIVRDGEHYDIIYISGAETGAHRWQPMAIKGSLWPTQFVQHFDMEWIDAHGVTLSDDNNAQLSTEGEILTLRFPAHYAQIRLKRALSPL